MKRGREYHDCGEEYTVGKKGKGEAISSSHNIEAFGKKINWGSGRKFRGEKKSILKNRNAEEYQVAGNFIHLCKFS